MKNGLTVIILLSLTSACGLFERAPKEPETLAMPAPVVEQFETECAALLAEHRGGVANCFLARDGWCYQGSELRYGAAGVFFGSQSQETYPKAAPEEADPLISIIHFKDQLDARGIELVFVPIPVRPVIYPEGVMPLGNDVSSDPLPHLKPMQDDFFRLVRDEGVRAINLSAFFLSNRHLEQGSLFCRSDTHWTPSGTALAANVVGQYLKSRRWYKRALKTYGNPDAPFSAEWLSKEHFGHLYRRLRDVGGINDLPTETVSYRKISGPGMAGEGGHKLRHPDSPVIVLGDSNMLIWNIDDAGFAQQLAFELGFHVDTMTTTGGGVNQARLNFIREVRGNPEYLVGKKVLLWTFTARTVLEVKAGWIKTPLP